MGTSAGRSVLGRIATPQTVSTVRTPTSTVQGDCGCGDQGQQGTADADDRLRELVGQLCRGGVEAHLRGARTLQEQEGQRGETQTHPDPGHTHGRKREPRQPPGRCHQQQRPQPHGQGQETTRSNMARDRSGCRPCQAEAPDQPSEPTINGALAAVSDQPWVEVSINGK